MPQFIRKAVNIVGIIITLCTAIAFSDRVWWVGELLSHPRPQYIIGLFIVIVSNFLAKLRLRPTLRRLKKAQSDSRMVNLRKVLHTAVTQTKRLSWLLLTIFLIATIVNTVILFNLPPLNPPQREGDHESPSIREGLAESNTANLTIIHFNIGLWTADRTDSYNWLRENTVDVILLQEVTPTVLDELSIELPDYKLIIAEPLWTTHGSAALIHASAPFDASGDIIKLLTNGRPLIHLTLEQDNHTIDLLSLHTTRPQNTQTSAYQANEFAAVAEWSAEHTNVILVGDFNTTPWSHRFSQLLETGDLHAPRTQPFRTSTWPSNLPIPFRIPIDQVVTSDTIQIVSQHVGAHLGSDHRPLNVSLNAWP